MSRFFDKTANDRIVCAAGAGSYTTSGPITIACLARPDTGVNTGWMIDWDDGSFERWGLLVSGGQPFVDNDFGGGPAYTAGHWYWIVATKASGTVAPRYHIYDVTAGSAWTHADSSYASVANQPGPVANAIIGGQSFGSASTAWKGSIAVCASWNSVLADATIETTMTLHARDTYTATPKWMVRLNQASVATAVTDDTGGGGDQTSISGTSVDADEPPGFDYSISAPAGITVAVWNGTTEISSTVAVWNGTTEVSATVDSIV